jgi:hypothetical protein
MVTKQTGWVRKPIKQKDLRPEKNLVGRVDFNKLVDWSDEELFAEIRCLQRDRATAFISMGGVLRFLQTRAIADGVVPKDFMAKCKEELGFSQSHVCNMIRVATRFECVEASVLGRIESSGLIQMVRDCWWLEKGGAAGFDVVKKIIKSAAEGKHWTTADVRLELYGTKEKQRNLQKPTWFMRKGDRELSFSTWDTLTLGQIEEAILDMLISGILKKDKPTKGRAPKKKRKPTK